MAVYIYVCVYDETFPLHYRNPNETCTKCYLTFVTQMNKFMAKIVWRLKMFNRVLETIIRKIFIRWGREKFVVSSTKECYSCGCVCVWHVHFALFEQLSIVYHWVGTWQHSIPVKESDVRSMVYIQNGKVSVPRYIQISICYVTI